MKEQEKLKHSSRHPCDWASSAGLVLAFAAGPERADEGGGPTPGRLEARKFRLKHHQRIQSSFCWRFFIISSSFLRCSGGSFSIDSLMDFSCSGVIPGDAEVAFL